LGDTRPIWYILFPMRKIYIVPNFVTTANLFCGFYSVVSSMHGDFTTAAWAVMAASVFDMLDGRVARLAKATSEFGVQYDSLSDLVSFGMAPGILLYSWALAPYGRLGWLAAFLFTTCGALRLARFNVNTGIVPKGFFQGLPIPMGAGMVATFVIFSQSMGWAVEQIQPVVLVLTFGVASLMVSTIKFPSFKELNWRSRASFGYLLVGVLAMILIAVRPEVTLFLVLSSYVGLSLGWNLMRLARKGSHATKATSVARSDSQGE
jgi:CDP-diacylglycerol--serine O-phosphatidyltransferase